MDVLVVGAGPVGLTMAAELARHGVRCRIIDRLAAPSPYCRAIGMTPRTLEVWDDLGIAGEMIDAGLRFAGQRTIIGGRPPRDELLQDHGLPYATLGIPQHETERILGRLLGRLGIEVERGTALAALSQDDLGVVAGLEGATGVRTEAAFRHVIGCDGARSTVRRLLGIPFEGDAFPMSFMLGDVRIDWGLPRGMILRALRPNRGGPPDMFLAVPLPEPGRYRVTMLAPPELAATAKGTTHGLVAEQEGPGLGHLQAIADDLLPERAVLSDLRWSSVFRIGMRLAGRYRQGRCFLAGDAAHIHPPTGGQGMNTGIQDAYNLAWKLALVLEGSSPASLLDSYEAERRPVGAEVIARTRAASERYGREDQPAEKPHPLADAQVLVSYRGTGWARDDGDDGDGASPLRAGDRAPDCGGLRRDGVGFPLRMFDALRGTEHVLIAALAGPDAPEELARLGRFAEGLRAALRDRLRVVAVAADDGLAGPFAVALLRDAEGRFAEAYGPGAFLVRPDGYLGWRGRSWEDPGLLEHLRRLFAKSAWGTA